MDMLRAKSFQEKIAREAIAMLSIGATADHHEQAVRLIGEVWRLPTEDTDTLLDKIQMERDVMKRLAEGTPEQHTINDEDLLANWSGLEIEETIEDLFETTIHLNRYDDRATMFQLMMELVETQNYLDWIEKTPDEEALPEAKLQ